MSAPVRPAAGFAALRAKRFGAGQRPALRRLRFLLLALSLASASVEANIYGFVDEHGVAHLATEKLDARYKLFSRTPGLESAGGAGAGKPEQLLRQLSEHPNLRKFEPWLQAASKDFSVDSALLKAVMAVESGFDPAAVSPKGAIGLMQVMPATAERYGLRGDGKRTLAEKLADPETNIRLGARYLRDLQRSFPGQPHLVLASYNAGEGAVQQYGGTVPPYPETQDYVRLVTQIYRLYRPTVVLPRLPARLGSKIGDRNGRLYLTLPGQRGTATGSVAGAD